MYLNSSTGSEQGETATDEFEALGRGQRACKLWRPLPEPTRMQYVYDDFIRLG